MSISDTTQQLNGAASAVQYPAESGHWYDPKTGIQVELPPRTWAKTAIKKGLVPGVTSITRLVARGALERWKINRAIWIARDEYMAMGMDGADECSDEGFQALVWERLDAESEAITGRGKELHAAIENYAADQGTETKWTSHIVAVNLALRELGIYLKEGSSEHSFATERYGGKVDWRQERILDWKTKDRLTDDNGKLKKLAYPEHAQQLAAYAKGTDLPLDAGHANVFVGVEDAAVNVHVWTPEELAKGWDKFECLLDYWWIDKS